MKKEIEVHNIEGGCKKRKKNYQDNYYLKHLLLPMTYPI
jgi:hypothetical protein